MGHNLSKKIKLNDQSSATHCFNVTICFLITWSLEMKNGSSMIMLNTNGIDSLWMNWHEVLVSLVYIPKRRIYVFGGVFANSFILNCWHIDKLWSIGSSKWIFNLKMSSDCQQKTTILFSNTIMQDRTVRDESWKNFMN